MYNSSRASKLIGAFPVGMVVTIGEAHMDVEPYSIGVVVEHIETKGGLPEGVSILFENGTFDGFSDIDIDKLDVVPQRLEISVAHYLFKDPLSLTFDFVQGAFDPAFLR